MTRVYLLTRGKSKRQRKDNQIAILKPAKSLAEHIASGFVETAGGTLFGAVLTLFIPEQPDPLQEAQVEQLKTMNETLSNMNKQLGVITTELQDIKSVLNDLVTGQVMDRWLSEQNPIEDNLSHIQASYEQYLSFIAQTPDGQLSTLPKSQIADWITRVFTGSNDTVHDDLVTIHQTLVGIASSDGLLTLYTNLQIEWLKNAAMAAKNWFPFGSEDLLNASYALIDYFTTFATAQLHGTLMLIEANRYQGLADAGVKRIWDNYISNIQTQGSLLISSIWRIMSYWRGKLPVNDPGKWMTDWDLDEDQMTSDNDPPGYAAQDMLAFMPGYTLLPGPAQWLAQNYATGLAQLISDGYLSTAEQTVDSFFNSELAANSKRIVAHVLSFNLMSPSINDDLKKPLVLTLPSGEKFASTFEFLVSNLQFPLVGDEAGMYFLARHIWELKDGGTYSMADLSAGSSLVTGSPTDTFPKWIGNDSSGSPTGAAPANQSNAYLYQSDKDLAQTVTIDDENPFGYTAFVPYLQTNAR